MWKTMLGVMEADCLQPSHNKQEFNTSQILYHKISAHLRSQMRFFYEHKQNVTTGAARLSPRAAFVTPATARSRGSKNARALLLLLLLLF